MHRGARVFFFISFHLVFGQQLDARALGTASSEYWFSVVELVILRHNRFLSMFAKCVSTRHVHYMNCSPIHLIHTIIIGRTIVTIVIVIVTYQISIFHRDRTTVNIVV